MTMSNTPMYAESVGVGVGVGAGISEPGCENTFFETLTKALTARGNSPHRHANAQVPTRMRAIKRGHDSLAISGVHEFGGA